MQFKRAHGPYKQASGGWKVILVRVDGKRVAQTVGTRAEANRAIDEARVEAAGGKRTIGDAVTEYLQGRAEEVSTKTVERDQYHLRRILGLPGNAARPISWLRRQGEALYEEARDGHKADTHRNALAVGKAFGRWLVDRRWLREDPFAEVKGKGQRRHGRDKPQLRVDEARKLTDFLLARCEPVVQPEAVAVLAAWLLGTRATELVVRDVRDLDDDGRRFVIPVGKTRRSDRSYEVPEVLRPLLLELARGRRGNEPLFRQSGRGSRWPAGRRGSRFWLYCWCDQLSREAGVPSVSPHGLRRSHISVAREQGATGPVVAAAVGHGSVQVQERSYLAAGAAERGRQRAVLKL